MPQSSASYRSIFKATSLFGGVQAYQILIGVVKSKIIAVLLGPLGVGIQGLYHSALQLVQNCTSLGLSQSAVRDVSEANGSNDRYLVGQTVATVRRLVWMTGLLGVIAVLLLSPVLSKTTFGDYGYIIPFAVLSITLLLDQLSAGQKVVLQGMRRLRYLALSSAIGITVALLVAIPLYYIWGVKGIVPAMIIQSMTQLFLTWYFSRKVDIQIVKISNREVLAKGRVMLSMGIAMSISSILTTLVAYVLRGCIRQWGGVEQVGLFTAGFTILSQYTGMIFNAMSTDFYPRLAAVNKDNLRCRELINQQGEVAILIIAPLLVICVVFMPFIIRLLYSEDFLQANDYILFAVLGIVFKTVSWVISYCFIAKGESKLFIINETTAKAYTLLFNLLGYRFYGLLGLGISFSISYFIYMVQVYLIARHRYSFSFTRSFKPVFLFQFLMVLCSFVLIVVWKSNFALIPSGIILCVSILFSLKELESRIQVKELIMKKVLKR